MEKKISKEMVLDMFFTAIIESKEWAGDSVQSQDLRYFDYVDGLSNMTQKIIDYCESKGIYEED